MTLKSLECTVCTKDWLDAEAGMQQLAYKFKESTCEDEEYNDTTKDDRIGSWRLYFFKKSFSAISTEIEDSRTLQKRVFRLFQQTRTCTTSTKFNELNFYLERDFSSSLVGNSFNILEGGKINPHNILHLPQWQEIY